MRRPDVVIARPWAVLGVIAVALACGDRKSDQASAASAASSASAPSATARSARALIATNAASSDSVVLQLAAATDNSLTGTQVRLPVAHVQSVMSSRGFWIGTWGQQVYVFQTAAAPTPVQGGEAYTVAGTVLVAPHSAQTAPRSMTPIDIEAMHAQHIYIVADTVTASGR